MDALLLPVGSNLYAVDMATAREVVVAPSVTELPHAPPTIVGVFNLRGEVVPVFDTARVLGLDDADACEFVAVVATSAGLAGLTMSGFGEAVRLEEPVGSAETSAGLGAYRVGDRLAILVDVEALLVPAGSDA